MTLLRVSLLFYVDYRFLFLLLYIGICIAVYFGLSFPDIRYYSSDLPD